MCMDDMKRSLKKQRTRNPDTNSKNIESGYRDRILH